MNWDSFSHHHRCTIFIINSVNSKSLPGRITFPFWARRESHKSVNLTVYEAFSFFTLATPKLQTIYFRRQANWISILYLCVYGSPLMLSLLLMYCNKAQSNPIYKNICLSSLRVCVWSYILLSLYELKQQVGVELFVDAAHHFKSCIYFQCVRSAKYNLSVYTQTYCDARYMEAEKHSDMALFIKVIWMCGINWVACELETKTMSESSHMMR